MTDLPDSVREEAGIRIVDLLRAPSGDLGPLALQIVDAIAPILRAADQREIARLSAELFQETQGRELLAEAQAEVARLTARLAEVEGALRWYADAKNYSDFCPGEMVQTAEGDGEWREDNGQRARAFLASAERL